MTHGPETLTYDQVDNSIHYKFIYILVFVINATTYITTYECCKNIDFGDHA